MDKIKSIFHNKKIISLLAAIISYSYLCFSNILPAYNELSWLVLACIILAFWNTDMTCEKCKDNRKTILIISALFAFLLLYGNLAYRIMFNQNESLLKSLFRLKSLLSYIGIFNIIYVLLINIYPRLVSYKMKNSIYKKEQNKIVFFGSLLVIFICWLPYFLRYFPGALTPDSMSELETILNGFKNVSDHHPILHVLFIAGPYNIGYKIFGSITAGVATATIVQMFSLASIFSYSIVFLYKRRVNKLILLLILLYYAIIPMHGYYSIVMWKDVMFSGMILLLTMELIKIIEKEKRNELKFKNMISFIIISLLCVFFRNNAIYMYCILAVFTFIIFKKYYKTFILVFAIVIGTYLVIKGPVFKALNIRKSASAEYIGMPLQQIGRMAYKNVKFTIKEKQLIDQIIPLEVMAESYNPQVSDGIKFNKSYNGEAFDNNKLGYLKLWLQLVIKHPSIAVEAYSISTLGYWYPGVNYWSVAKGIYENERGLELDSKINNKYMTYYLDHIDSRGIPILSMQWSIGLCYWIMLLFAIVTIKIKNKKSLYVFIPVFGIWVTMLLASPVFAEFRYVYCAFVALPLLMTYPYMTLKSKI